MEKVYALWYGGSSWSLSYMEDLEEFDSLDKAKREFVSRLHNQREFPDVNEENCEMQIFFDDPTDSRDPYPDLILKIENGETVEIPC